MVLTLKFDKNSQRYITFNLQRLSRTVLVYMFLNCLLPTNIRNFSPKKPMFLKKGGKEGGKQVNSKQIESQTK